jgi:RNA polymerase sigma factor (TIGR02999 family)
MADVARMQHAIERGETQAVDGVLPVVYDELRRLAAIKLAREPAGHALQATALVHEAYLRLVTNGRPAFASQGHFFAAAAESMRRILVDRARRRSREKHGGGRKHFELADGGLVGGPKPRILLALDEALDQAAQVMEISRATACRYWNYAKAWLYREISGCAEAV